MQTNKESEAVDMLKQLRQQVARIPVIAHSGMEFNGHFVKDEALRVVDAAITQMTAVSSR